MAKHGVLVRRLNAIENLGQHGHPVHGQDRHTHRRGRRARRRVRPDGQPSRRCSSSPRSMPRWKPGSTTRSTPPFSNAGPPHLAGIEKIAEIPFDFTRKRLSSWSRVRDHRRLITKGAFDHVLGSARTLARWALARRDGARDCCAAIEPGAGRACVCSRCATRAAGDSSLRRDDERS